METEGEGIVISADENLAEKMVASKPAITKRLDLVDESNKKNTGLGVTQQLEVADKNVKPTIKFPERMAREDDNMAKTEEVDDVAHSHKGMQHNEAEGAEDNPVSLEEEDDLMFHEEEEED